MLDRRTLLRAAPVAAVTAVAPVIATAEPGLFTNPDAALFDAWSRYTAGCRAIEALVEADRLDDDDPDRIAAYVMIDTADDILLTAPWHTPAGLVVKLRRMMLLAEPSIAVYRAVIHGRPITDADLDALGIADRLPVTMLQHAETMARQGCGYA